jgi:glycosyltransferase involved in cell wall biosynthesis
MLCYYFPPIRSSGTARSLEFAIRLPRHGWDPVVLTVRDAKELWSTRQEPEPENIEIRRSREFNLHGLVNLLHGSTCRIARIFGSPPERNYFFELLCLPDAQIAWQSTRPGIRIAREVDVIYASCSPFSSAISACKIKRRTGLPLVVDFRDPWSLNTHHTESPFRQWAIRRYERRVVEHCDRLVLNSEGAAELYRATYPEVAGKFSVIPNGYDTLNLATPRDPSQRTSFTIMHIGHFYGSRQPDRLLEAIRIIGDPSVEFVQVGDPFPSFEQYSRSVPIRLIPSVPRAEALKLMTTASLLYLVQGRVGQSRDIAVAAKTFEYLATGLPILADCPPGDNADIVSRFAVHPFVVTSGRTEEIATALRMALVARGDAQPKVNDEFSRLFDREYLTGRLKDVLESVLPADSNRA